MGLHRQQCQMADAGTMNSAVRNMMRFTWGAAFV